MLQSKTKAQLNLPLTEEVGQALIDYLRNGRPQTIYRQVFLKATAPYEPFGPTADFYGIVSLYRHRAGIVLPARSKRGMHSLRHTMATRLLERETPLETIAGVLGHQSLDSTRIYAKVDIAALRDAALDPEEANHA
jgi:site-specific recombinase XerD